VSSDEPHLSTGPGRSRSDAPFIACTNEIAQRNEQAQKEASKLRTAREEAQGRRRCQEDLRQTLRAAEVLCLLAR
jgi:hypothetical protein